MKSEDPYEEEKIKSIIVTMGYEFEKTLRKA